MALGTVAISLAAQTPPAPSGLDVRASAATIDPALVKSGEVLYQQVCAACHGAEGAGGPGGIPSLLRSPIATAPDNGRTLGEFLQVGRPVKGMPPYPATAQQAAGLSAKLRSLAQAAAPSPADFGRRGEPVSVLVGDANAGKAYFNGSIGQCSSCHAVRDGEASPAANLAHIATKYPDPKALQNNMVLNRTFFWSPAVYPDITATVTYRDGRVITGFLTSVSDFKVIVRDREGRETVIVRRDGEPRVDLKDRLQHHLDLLPRYRDSDISNLTAYLVTLK